MSCAALDLFHATSVHRLLQSLLNLPQPRLPPSPPVADRDGKKLSKSQGDTGIAGAACKLVCQLPIFAVLSDFEPAAWSRPATEKVRVEIAQHPNFSNAALISAP